MLLQKILPTLAIAVAALTAHAVTPDKTINGESGNMLPACFAYNGEPAIYFEKEDLDQSNFVYTLYSSAFTEKGTVEFHTDKVVLASSAYTYNPPIINYSYRVYNEMTYVSTLADAEEYANTYYCTEKIQVEGMYYFFPEEYLPQDRSALTTIAKIEELLSRHTWENAYEAIQYSRVAYVTFSPSVGLTAYAFDEYDLIGYSDEFVREETSSGSEQQVYPKPLYVRDMRNNREFYNSLMITQCLFNEDENYEALIPLYETYTVTTDESMSYYVYTPKGKLSASIPAKYEYTAYAIRGVNIVKGNSGEVVATFEIPKEYYTNSVDTYLYIDGESKHLCLQVFSAPGDYLLVYELPSSAGSGAVMSPKLIETVKVCPTIVKQGEDINIEVGDDTEIEAITVTDMKGATRRVTPSADKSRTAINSGRLSRGMHIVGVQTGNGTQNSKVIVK